VDKTAKVDKLGSMYAMLGGGATTWIDVQHLSFTTSIIICQSILKTER